MLFKEIVDGRTHGRTDDGRRTLKDHKSSLSTLCSGELKTYICAFLWLLVNLTSAGHMCFSYLRQLHQHHALFPPPLPHHQHCYFINIFTWHNAHFKKLCITDKNNALKFSSVNIYIQHAFWHGSLLMCFMDLPVLSLHSKSTQCYQNEIQSVVPAGLLIWLAHCWKSCFLPGTWAGTWLVSVVFAHIGQLNSGRFLKYMVIAWNLTILQGYYSEK